MRAVKPRRSTHGNNSSLRYWAEHGLPFGRLAFGRNATRRARSTRKAPESKYSAARANACNRLNAGPGWLVSTQGGIVPYRCRGSEALALRRRPTARARVPPYTICRARRARRFAMAIRAVLPTVLWAVVAARRHSPARRRRRISTSRAARIRTMSPPCPARGRRCITRHRVPASSAFSIRAPASTPRSRSGRDPHRTA